MRSCSYAFPDSANPVRIIVGLHQFDVSSCLGHWPVKMEIHKEQKVRVLITSTRNSLSRFLLNAYNILLSLHNSTHWGCIRTMSIVGLLGALYVYMTMHAFGFSSFFAFHPSVVSFAALLWLPPPQSDSCSAICGWRSAWPIGRASTLALLDYS